MDHAARGQAALAQHRSQEAIEHYNAAIAANPTAVTYYIQRATALQRANLWGDALRDADMAVVLAHKRGKRELIKEAQMRRGIVLFHLSQYGDALFVFNIVKKLDEKDNALGIWLAKVSKKMEELPEDHDSCKVTVKEIPDVKIPTASGSQSAAKTGPNKAAAVAAAAPKPVVPTPANKIKHDWYQSGDKVCVNLLAKGVPKDSATVDIEENSLTISFPTPDSPSDYIFVIDPLCGRVDVAQSSYKITPHKIEVVLKKAVPGVKWPNLEEDPEDDDEFGFLGKPPAYPTSSIHGAKNWDDVVKTAALELADQKLAADASNLDLADDEGDETTRFFRQLYQHADPAQQRAMMKSFTESGGTVLSTDWGNVASKTVVPEPPDGMEAKKY